MAEVKVDLSGEMDVSSSDSRSAFDFSSYSNYTKLPGPMELIQMTRKYVRPWSEFLNTSNLKSAPSMPRLTGRVVRNLSHFQSNYIIVFIILMIYCLVTSPLILVVLAAVAYGSHKIKKAQTPFSIFGYELSTKQQIVAMNLLSVPVLFLVGAGSALFWTLGASCFAISLHAIFYNIDAIEADDTDGFMSEVV